MRIIFRIRLKLLIQFSDIETRTLYTDTIDNNIIDF